MKRNLKTIKLTPEELARRLYWRYYQIHCVRLIKYLGIKMAWDMRPKEPRALIELEGESNEL